MSSQELPPNVTVFGRYLRFYRERRHVGLRQLAADIKVIDAATISRWENGLQMPRIGQADAIFLICERLGLDRIETVEFYRIAGFGTPEERREAMQKATSAEHIALPKPNEIKPGDTDKDLPNLQDALRVAGRMPPAPRMPRGQQGQLRVSGWWSSRTEPLEVQQPMRLSALEQLERMVETAVAEREEK